MRYFLILISYNVPIETIEAHTPEHRAYLKTLYDAGDLLMSGPFVPRTGGLLWARVQNRERVDEIIAGDPFEKHSLASYTVIEFNPVMHSPLVDRVFE